MISVIPLITFMRWIIFTMMIALDVMKRLEALQKLSSPVVTFPGVLGRGHFYTMRALSV